MIKRNLIYECQNSLIKSYNLFLKATTFGWVVGAIYNSIYKIPLLTIVIKIYQYCIKHYVLKIFRQTYCLLFFSKKFLSAKHSGGSLNMELFFSSGKFSCIISVIISYHLYHGPLNLIS